MERTRARGDLSHRHFCEEIPNRGEQGQGQGQGQGRE
jgi:hypothetical protein